MQITRQADYAVRAIIYLSMLNPGEKASTKTIAENQSIPLSFLAKIIAQLSVAGIITTLRGAKGGVSLAKPPEEISVLEVVEAIDGPILLNACVVSTHDCPIEKCAMRGIWIRSQRDLVKELKNTNFQYLADKMS
jgi:Rrf2 family protein